MSSRNALSRVSWPSSFLIKFWIFLNSENRENFQLSVNLRFDKWVTKQFLFTSRLSRVSFIIRSIIYVELWRVNKFWDIFFRAKFQFQNRKFNKQSFQQDWKSFRKSSEFFSWKLEFKFKCIWLTKSLTFFHNFIWIKLEFKVKIKVIEIEL